MEFNDDLAIFENVDMMIIENRYVSVVYQLSDWE